MLISPLNTARFPVPYEWGVEPDPAAVPPARRLVVETARDWSVPFSDDALRDVDLCAGELVADAGLRPVAPFPRGPVGLPCTTANDRWKEHHCEH